MKKLKFQRPTGMHDILPAEQKYYRKVYQVGEEIVSFYGFRRIDTLILEGTELFSKGTGSSTDIIQKQMFYIKHQKDKLVLRPEATASVVRAYLENNLEKKSQEAKFYYLGPMFRAERPQKGRLRQFHHIGIEAIGSLSPQLDIEVISLSDRLLRELGVKDYRLYLNSLGCSKDKLKFSKQLQLRLKNKLSKLCSD